MGLIEITGPTILRHEIIRVAYPQSGRALPTIGQNTNSNMVNGQAEYCPILVRQTVTATVWALQVTTGGTGGALEGGIYYDAGGPNPQPGARLTSVSSGMSTALGSRVVAINRTLTPGIWWTATLLTGSTVAPGVKALAGHSPFILAANETSGHASGYVEAGLATLPATATPLPNGQPVAKATLMS